MSVQFAMDCNYYNQGCDGGYSMLVGKFGSEQFLLEEKHKKYIGKNMKCGEGLKNLDSIKNAVKIKDYGYIEGRYGLSNHYNIMKELKNNGPLVLSFSPDEAFQYYSEGVYQSIQPVQWYSQNIQRPEWTLVDHSILVYGWGEEQNGIKYWLCLNSWGDDFGIKGSFKIKRGEDTMGIESSAEFVDPYIVDEQQLNQIKEDVKIYKDY